MAYLHLDRIRSRAAACALVIAALVAGCGSKDDDGGSPTDVLLVTPGTAQLEVVNGTPATQVYSVQRVAVDGTAKDVTASVTWVVADFTIGQFSGATFRALGARGGKTMVRATLDGLVGEAQVEVTIKGARVGEGVPANAPELFAQGTNDPATGPVIVYPADQVIVPSNLGDLEAHWTDAHGHDLFELSLQGDHVDMRMYLRGGATGWAGFTVSEWEAVARSTDKAIVRLRALTEASPATIGLALDRTVQLTNDELMGGLYYWGTPIMEGQNYGIFRYDFGEPAATAEETFTVRQAGRCVACHTLSRDGTKMAVGYDGGNQSSTIVDIATQTAMVPRLQEYWNFATFTPDGTRLITSHDGVLTVRDGRSGIPDGTVPTGGYATHPDFAADGLSMVYTAVTGGGQDWHFTGGTIARISYDPASASWGTPTTIIGDTATNNYYPSFSPDGRWILFNRSTEDAYDDASAELWVVRADGSSPARKLDLANVGTGLTNSWARWAPFHNSFGRTAEEMYWITFSSKRTFGVRLAGGQPQLWMAAFFPGRVETGGDPTAPAFRLPFQDIGSNNHIAQWTETVVPIGKIQQTPVAPLPTQVMDTNGKPVP